ncbi:hypothetical protein EON63_23330, partial [archaeon]
NSTANIIVQEGGVPPLVVGNKTEGALLLFCAGAFNANYVNERALFSAGRGDRLLTFSSKRKRMSVAMHRDQGGDKEGNVVVFTKGASEIVLTLCTHFVDAKVSVYDTYIYHTSYSIHHIPYTIYDIPYTMTTGQGDPPNRLKARGDRGTHSDYGQTGFKDYRTGPQIFTHRYVYSPIAISIPVLILIPMQRLLCLHYRRTTWRRIWCWTRLWASRTP